MRFTQPAQQIIIIPITQGLCFSIVEASRT
jgi:hypothetical protein